MRASLLLYCLFCLSAPLVACSGEESTDEDRRSFVLAVIPDTQFYSENGRSTLNPRYPGLPYEPIESFRAITGWLAENAQTYHIPFVIHVGDIIQSGGDQPRSQWQRASDAMLLLEEAVPPIPYSVAPGNHDVRDSGVLDSDRFADPDYERFLHYFSQERAAAHATFLERDPIGFSEAHRFEAVGQSFLVIALDWRPSDATIAWAQSVLDRYPTTPAILMSHQILTVDGSTNTPVLSDHGERLWEALIADNDQIFLTINGHHHYAAHRSRTNRSGQIVYSVLVDYQDEYGGGNGLLRLLEFDFEEGRIDALTFSAWALRKMTDPELAELLRPCETPERTDNCDQLLPEPNTETMGVYYDNQFSLELDFRARFASFNGYTATPKLSAPLLLPRLRAALEALH